MIDATISVQVSENISLNVVSFINDLVKGGWKINDHGKISYLPLGDDDDFDWQNVPLTNENSVLKEIEEKQRSEEYIGIVLCWNETEVGFTLLIDFQKRNITFSLDINRLEDKKGTTDFKWYIAKIFPILEEHISKVKSINIMQVDSGGQIEFKKVLNDFKSEIFEG